MSENLVQDRVRRLVAVAEGERDPGEELREAIERELREALAEERKRVQLSSVVAMSEEDAVRYRVISELASDWVYALRIDEFGKFQFEWTSGSFDVLTGYIADEVNELGGLAAIVHPDDVAVLNSLDGPFAKGVPSTISYRLITKSGRELWVRDYARPETDRAGNRVVRIFGAAKDVTTEITAQQALEEAKASLEHRVGFEEARFRAVLDQAGEAIYMLDPASGQFIDVNATACHMLGYSRDELLEMTAEQIEASAPVWTLPERQKELRTTGLSTESTYVRKDGTQFPVEVAVSLRKYVGRNYLLMVARDIADRKQMEIQLAQADRLASVGVLAAGVAHEINNPLVYILNNITYALGEVPATNSELRDALREARSGAERVRDIVQDLKTFARSDERLGPMDVRQVLDTSLKVANNEIRFRAQLVREYEADMPLVRANARLGQVFLNLLMNAAHAIREGNPEQNRITVCVRSKGPFAEIAIRDTGSGIDAEDAKKIFDPFYTTKPMGMGTGLGLSICRNIVHSFHGEIEVESEQGKGSTFTVRLPALAQRARDTGEKSSSIPPSSSSSLRILVVDDDALVARAVRRLLMPRHKVTLAPGGLEALELLRDNQFDIVFCDVMMPAMTGMEVHRAVAAQDPDMARRFIFITGGPFTPDAREAFEQVRVPCIQKPFTVGDLVQALERVASNSVHPAAQDADRASEVRRVLANG